MWFETSSKRFLKMSSLRMHILLLNAFLFVVNGQQYDFAAEISRQCLVPDPVGLLDCVENKVDLPYLTSWVACTNSLGENVATSADIINYRCKSVWEGKGVIPQVFYIKDCVIERTGLPAKDVSAKVLGAYKECEKSSPTPGGSTGKGVKSSPAPGNIVQQTLPIGSLAKPYQSSAVQYSQPGSQQIVAPATVPQIQSAAVNQRSAQPQQQQNSEYDFAAEITRQCLVPDPVGLLDCVENKVDLPYLSSWVDCTNSLGQNVATSADIINYRCKSVWEGKGVIPEVFYIKDCVIEKTGLPAKDVSAKVLGAYKECERNPPKSPRSSNQGIKSPAAVSAFRPQQQFGQRTKPANTQPEQQPSSDYDFAAEIARQCRVPDPVGLLDCVENKVNLPYLTSWVSCTNSLGQNVATSADVINYRCKSVWEGKAVIPEVIWIKDCVIEKTGLPAKNVSAEVLGAYKECENSAPKTVQKPNQQTKSSPVQIKTRGGTGVQAVVPKAQFTPRTRQYFMLYPMQPVSQANSQKQNAYSQKTTVSSKPQPQQPGKVAPQQQHLIIQQQPIQPQFSQQQFAQKPIQQQFAQNPIQQQFGQRPIQQQFAQKPIQQQFAQKPIQQQFAQKPIQQQFAQKPIQQQFGQKPIQQQLGQRPIQQQFAQKPTQQQFAQKPIQQQFVQKPIQQQFGQKPIQQQFAQKHTQQPAQQQLIQKPIQQQFGQRPVEQQVALKSIQQQFSQKPIQQQFSQKPIQQQFSQKPSQQQFSQKPIQQQFSQKPTQQQFAPQSGQQQLIQKPIQQQFGQRPIQQQTSQGQWTQQLKGSQQEYFKQQQSPNLQVIQQQIPGGQHHQPTVGNPIPQHPSPNAHYYSFITTHPLQQKTVAV